MIIVALERSSLALGKNCTERSVADYGKRNISLETDPYDLGAAISSVVLSLFSDWCSAVFFPRFTFLVSWTVL